MSNQFGKWVSVAERKPEDGVEVWVCLTNGDVTTDVYRSKYDGMLQPRYNSEENFFWEMSGWDWNADKDDPYPVYWMEQIKPKPPKEVQKESK